MPPKPKSEEITKPVNIVAVSKGGACPVCGNAMSGEVCAVDGYREGAPKS